MVGTLVLNNHPTGISVEDLRYELREDEDDDSVDQAIGAMTNEGLLRRKGQMVQLGFTPVVARAGLLDVASIIGVADSRDGEATSTIRLAGLADGRGPARQQPRLLPQAEPSSPRKSLR